MSAPYTIERLDRRHDRAPFTCGSAALDTYFRSIVTQDVKRRLCACFVAVHKEKDRVAGFYTLAMSSIALENVGADIARRLPRYPLIPAVRLGRLGVDIAYAGQGLGGVLLVNALSRSALSEIAAFAMVVDAKDETAAAFYSHHGFMAFENRPLQLYLPLARPATVAPD